MRLKVTKLLCILQKLQLKKKRGCSLCIMKSYAAIALITTFGNENLSVALFSNTLNLN